MTNLHTINKKIEKTMEKQLITYSNGANILNVPLKKENKPDVS